MLGWGGQRQGMHSFFFLFLRGGFGRFADIHQRIPEGDARFWLLPGLFSPASRGQAEDSAWLWPRSLTYDSKKPQNPQRSQGAPSTVSVAQIRCVSGTREQAAQDQPRGLLSVALAVEACSPRGIWSLSADRAVSLGRWPTEARPPAPQGCSLRTAAPSGQTQETAAPPGPLALGRARSGSAVPLRDPRSSGPLRAKCP